MTLLSRVGGLLRDVLVFRLFGATALGSAFAAGFTIPNLFRRLFGEGALSAAFIPEYTRLRESDPDRAHQLASLTVFALALVTGAITLLIELVLLGVLVFAPGSPERVVSLQLIMVMLPFMPFICVAAILGGVLQVHGKFGPAASGPLLLNAFIIAVAAAHMLLGRAGDLNAALLVGVATVLSGVAQCLWFARLLRPHVRWTRAFHDAREPARRMTRKFLPVLLGLGTLQINTFLDTVIAMWPIWVGPTILGRPYPLDQASNALLASAQRPYQFPLGVFGIAVATAIFPLLSRHAPDPESFASTLRRGVRLSFYIGLPASIGLLAVATPLIAVIYSGGGLNAFDAEAVRRAAAVLVGFAPAVWAYSLNHVLTRAFYARGDTLTPMRVSIAMVGINLALNLTLIWPLREAGLAWATSAAACLQCLILARLCRTRLGVRVIDAPTARGFARVVAAGLGMGAALAAVSYLLPGGSGFVHELARLSISTAAGAGVYLALSKVLGLPELGWLLARPPKGADTAGAAMPD